MKLFHPKVNLVFFECVVVTLAWLPAVSMFGQTVSTNALGDRIIKYTDGTWRYYEGQDSLLLPVFPLEELISNGTSSPINKPEEEDTDTIIYDYRLFVKYVSAAVKYETLMLDKVDENSEKTFALQELIAAKVAENNTQKLAEFKAELAILNKRKQDDQRLLSYARSLIKKILKIGKKEDYKKLAKIYVPGLIPEKEMSREDSIKVHQKLEVRQETAPDLVALPKELSEKEGREKKSWVDSSATSEKSQEQVQTEGEDKASDKMLPGVKIDDPSTETKQKKDVAETDQNRASSKNLKKGKVAKKINSELAAVPDSAATFESNVIQNDSLRLAMTEEADLPEETLDEGLDQNSSNTVFLQVDSVESQDSDGELVLTGATDEASQNDTPANGLMGSGAAVQERDSTYLEAQGNEGLRVESHEASDLPEPQNESVQISGSAAVEDARLGRVRLVPSNVPREKWFAPAQASLPAYNCNYAFQGTDEFTNQQKKELRPELFFTHTDERLKPYFKDRDYVACEGYLTSISGGFRYLTLVVTIASPNATREYGNIRNGSLLNIKLLDDETVSLFSQSESQGLQDPKTRATIYKIRFPIDYQKEKILSRSGVDKVRIVWSSGYEDYEVYNVDFFGNQLNCLNSK